MSFWDILTYVAWSLSAIMLMWMVVDAFMISSQYDEEFLMSSREGEDDVMHGVELDGEIG
ncbi:hypothetical protein MTYP_00485 [Methylophilaceae bacterium]|nr:hypothetical protein MTYP_00485 [Methylophilaceae bacterium]